MQIINNQKPQSSGQNKVARVMTILFGLILTGIAGWLMLLQYTYTTYGQETSGHVTSSTSGGNSGVTYYEFTLSNGSTQTGVVNRVTLSTGSSITITYLPFLPYFNKPASFPAQRETKSYPYILAVGILFLLFGFGSRKQS
ncbi:MAG: hypothetical protein V4473_01605 [Patescibacteria group bacterium]